MNFPELKKVFKENIYFEDPNIIDVVMGSVVANYFKHQRVSLIILNTAEPFLDILTYLPFSWYGVMRFFGIESFDLNYLFWKLYRSESLRSNQIKITTTVITNITPFLVHHRQKFFRMLNIFDAGKHKFIKFKKERIWTGEIGIIASTLSQDTELMKNDFLMYRLPTFTQPEDLLFPQSTKMGYIKQTLWNAVNNYLREIKYKRFPKNIEISQQYKERLEVLKKQSHHSIAFFKKLLSLGIGLAVVQEKEEFDDQIMDILTKVIWDSFPYNLSRILYMLGKINKKLTATELSQLIDMRPHTIYDNLKRLAEKGIVTQNLRISVSKEMRVGGKTYEWRLK